MFVSKAMHVFVTIFQEKNLKCAASKLCLTVTPVSRMLKKIEQSLGEPLFTIERNRVTPTPFAQRMYNILLPHYLSLIDIKMENKKRKCTLASPLANNSIFTKLLIPQLSLMDIMPVVICSEKLQDYYDVFFTFDDIMHPVFFSKKELLLQMSLTCHISSLEGWHALDLFASQEVVNSNHFQTALKQWKALGYFGQVHQVDNDELQIIRCNKGHGLTLQLESSLTKETCKLPLAYSQPLYVYENTYTNNPHASKIVEKIETMIRA